MRFRDIHRQHMIGAWESEYVPYQQLKALLKAADQHGYERFFVDFAQAIASNTTFATQRLAFLQRHEEELENQWAHSSLTKHRSSLDHLSLISLRGSLLELACFYRLNQEAIDRVNTKLFKCEQNCDIGAQHYWDIIYGHQSTHRNGYNSCVSQLDRVQAKLARETPTLYLSEDDGSTLRHTIENLTEEEGYIKNLLQLSAINSMVDLWAQVLCKAITDDKALFLRGDTCSTLLFASVAQDQVDLTKLLLSVMINSNAAIPQELLHIAMRRQLDTMVELLITYRVGIGYKTSTGETCAHIASQVGRCDYLQLLLSEFTADLLDTPESVCQRTPLFIACIEGHESIARLLLDKGVDPRRLDYLGWTAKEHAAFMGHIPIAEMFPDDTIPTDPILPSQASLGKVSSQFNANSGKGHVILNLGGLQDRGISASSTLDLLDLPGGHVTLCISVSESSAIFERKVPLLRDPVDDTMVFVVDNPSKASVRFELRSRPSEDHESSHIVGAGMTSLNIHTPFLSVQYEPLMREQTVSIFCRDTLRPLGTISFSYLLVEPYHRLQESPPSLRSPEDDGSVVLVGHRGFGQNSRERYLQHGENTIESIIAAGNLGAQFVEFGNNLVLAIRIEIRSQKLDVQVTKDLVPVLFHDYSLSETGTDIPIHDVTLDQFLYASIDQSTHESPDSRARPWDRATPNASQPRSRPHSRSFTTARDPGPERMKTRMKHTADYSINGFKPNTRGDFIHHTFATLEQALRNVPEHIGFDMEIKYPRIHESLAARMPPISLNINLFVDTILDIIATHAGSRKILLSSFTPEICILLAIKQRSYPVLFITNAGKRPLVDKDKRAGSLQAAIRFARQWGLDGIVTAADVLVLCPRLVGWVKAKGLSVGSYNGLNNESMCVERQARAGVDLLVADRVGLVRGVLDRLGVEGADVL